MVRRHSTPGPVPRRSAAVPRVPRVPRHPVPRLSTTTRHRPQLCSSPLSCFSFALTIQSIDSRRAIRLAARRRRAASPLVSSNSAGFFLSPTTSSPPSPPPMHCRCHSRTVFSLSHLPSSPVWRPPLSHTPALLSPRMRLLIVPKCRYQSTPLCRLEPDPHE